MIQDAIGVDRDDAIGELAYIPNGVMGHLLRGFAFLAVACLINAQHERPASKGLTQEGQPSGAHLFDARGELLPQSDGAPAGPGLQPL